MTTICVLCKERPGSRLHDIYVPQVELTIQIGIHQPDAPLCLPCLVHTLEVLVKPPVYEGDGKVRE